MKYLLLLLILLYGKLFSPLLKNILGAKKFCRFYPTCSDYARLSIQKYGAYRGISLSIKRLIKCQPFYRA